MRAGGRPAPLVARAALVLGLLAIWEGVVASGLASADTVPPPSDWVPRLGEVLATGQFWSDAARSAQTTALAFAAACAVGLTFGTLLARAPGLARVLEPYLVGAYAIPVVVFYPTLLVIMGLGTGPIIVTAFLGAVVPVALTTTVALGQQPPVLGKLARSLVCTRWQALRTITLPAVLPLLLPGVKLGFVYALAATIGVEFIVASAGLGFRTGELYRNFEVVDMYAHIVALFGFAVLANEAFNRLERVVRRDLA